MPNQDQGGVNLVVQIRAIHRGNQSWRVYIVIEEGAGKAVSALLEAYPKEAECDLEVKVLSSLKKQVMVTGYSGGW